MDPATGRFTQEDTYQGNLYDPATLHKYSYANDNPVVYCDPSGYFGAFVGAAVISIAACLNNMSSIIYAGLLAANISAISAFALGKGDIESAAIIGFLIGAAFASGGFILEALNVMTLLEYGMGLSAVTFSFESAYAIGNFAKGHYKEGALHATFSLVALVDCINLYGSWSNTDIASDGNISGYANYLKDHNRLCLQNGADRAYVYSSEWREASLKEAIEKFAPDAVPTQNEKGKIIYRNDETGIEVVYDKLGDYFRIEDTNRGGKRNYLDMNGKDMNNVTINGKTRGRSKSEYRRLTHFKNSDKKEQ